MNQAPVRERNFSSDNNSGICPEAWESLVQANCGHAPAYGSDTYTAAAQKAIQDVFETDCRVFFVLTGTAANSLAVAHLCSSHHSILCHEGSHLSVGECAGPEFFSGGSKLILIPGGGGKLEEEPLREAALAHAGGFHFPPPKMASLTQATELGTVYQPEHLEKLCRLSHDLHMHVHMDGARLANALSHLGCSPAELTWRAGIDVLSFGGTKNGLGSSEAVVFFHSELAQEFEYRWKQAGQVASKMRFLSAPWIGFLETGAWLRNARHANTCALRLGNALQQIEGVQLLYPCQANMLFLQISSALTSALQSRGWRVEATSTGIARLVCSWDTREEDIDALVADFQELAPTVRHSDFSS